MRRGSQLRMRCSMVGGGGAGFAFGGGEAGGVRLWPAAGEVSPPSKMVVLAGVTIAAGGTFRSRNLGQ